MARLIDADALKKAIMAEPWKNEPNMVRLTVDYINIIIDEQPTVDAVPVVRRWWIEVFSMEPEYECSECGRTYAWWEPSEAHYCPNCGAKMDLEVE